MGVIFMNGLLPSDVFPLDVGKRWSYTINTGLLFSRNADVTVTDKKGNLHVVKVNSGKFTMSLIVKSDVDMSIIAYSRTGASSLEDDEAFEPIPKIEILKSPLVSGINWDNNFGSFKIINTDYKLKLDKKVYSNCIFLQLKDNSNASNDIFIKNGVGIVFASIYIDGIGKAYLNLKSLG
jgi:hypothetical protein